MSEIEELTNLILEFRDARDWKQFHNPKEIAISMILEAGEVLEHFQWKSKEEMQEYMTSHKEDIGEEVADVFYWILLLSHDLGISPIEALKKKIKKNELKYPIEKAKGNHDKYTKFD